VPIDHPRCNQHGLVAPDGMCVLCRKQASSGPPAKQRVSVASPQPTAASTAPESPDKFAALLVGLALMTMATTYILETARNKELASSPDATQRADAQREEAESARLQQWLVASTRADNQPAAAVAHDRVVERQDDDSREPE
jgi:hypothetical protein